MNEQIEKLLCGYREEMMRTTQKWIQMPSVKGTDVSEGAPFGQDVRRMLDTAMSDAAEMGFVTAVFDGYAGHAEMGEGSC